MPELLVGTSGYNYRHWGQGVFYPPGLSSHRWLEYYAQHFGAVELNVTFYRLPEPKTFAGWHRRTPNDFRFVVKGSRLITHVRRLKGVEDALAVFFQNASALGDKLSCALWQLPPRFPQDVGLLAQFIRQLPRSCRHSIEFRDESWLTEEVYELLREAGISLCLADRPLNMAPVVTADFVYVRRHGSPNRASSCYSQEELERDARSVRSWLEQGLDVYVFFNNDARGYAVENARTLKSLLGEQ